MNSAGLLQSQSNEVLEAIQEAGLNPSEFKFVGSPDPEMDNTGEWYTPDYYPQLFHSSSRYWFLFGNDFAKYTPGSESIEQTDSKINWLGKIAAFRRWLGYLKREVEAPDLWAALAQEQEMLGAEPAEAINAPFSAEEQVQVKRAIEEIRIYITSTYSLGDEPLAEVNRKLDYLIDASIRLGRIDWKNICVATLFSLAVQYLTPSGPDVRELFSTAWHLLRHVLGSVVSPPLLH